MIGHCTFRLAVQRSRDLISISTTTTCCRKLHVVGSCTSNVDLGNVDLGIVIGGHKKTLPNRQGFFIYRQMILGCRALTKDRFTCGKRSPLVLLQFFCCIKLNLKQPKFNHNDQKFFESKIKSNLLLLIRGSLELNRPRAGH